MAGSKNDSEYCADYHCALGKVSIAWAGWLPVTKVNILEKIGG
jgi:hypothetical protein